MKKLLTMVFLALVSFVALSRPPVPDKSEDKTFYSYNVEISQVQFAQADTEVMTLEIYTLDSLADTIDVEKEPGLKANAPIEIFVERYRPPSLDHERTSSKHREEINKRKSPVKRNINLPPPVIRRC